MAASKFLKRLLCLIMVLTMLLSLSGCGIGTAITAAKTARAMSKLKSVSGEMLLELELPLELDAADVSTRIPVNFRAPMDFIVSPFVLQADSRLEIDADSLPLLKMFMEKDGEKLNMYLGRESRVASLLGEDMIWTAQSTTLSGEGVKLDVKTIMGLYLLLSESFHQADKETVGKFKAQRYDGALPREIVSAFFSGTGGITVSGITLTEKALIDALSDTPISFWLDTDSSCLVKLEVDLSRGADALLLDILSQLLGEVESSITKAVLSFTVSEFDSVAEIIIPDEARDALNKIGK